MHGQETSAFGDAGYRGVDKHEEASQAGKLPVASGRNWPMAGIHDRQIFGALSCAAAWLCAPLKSDWAMGKKLQQL